MITYMVMRVNVRTTRINIYINVKTIYHAPLTNVKFNDVMCKSSCLTPTNNEMVVYGVRVPSRVMCGVACD